jgi:uncharacterized protein YuzB (UPF0349 family)
MKKKRTIYNHDNWDVFSNDVKQRDGFKCLKCGSREPNVILQVHHRFYKAGVEPWEYPLSDCITLCKGCHAREHNLIEPENGWTLISIEDLGGLDGICERKGCGAEIRYEHITYHPQWGYKTVGSTCVEHLTQDDQFLSQDVLRIFKNTSNFLYSTIWEKLISHKGKHYLMTTYSNHQIRIYGDENYYSFQIALKRKGEKWFDFQGFVKSKNKSLERVKELSYIVLNGLITENDEEKELLRNIYKRIR